jgi:hypothetical protein
MLLLFGYWDYYRHLGGGDVVIICILGMLLLFVHWECCCYLCIWNDVVCVLGMLLLFVYLESCCYLYIWKAVVIWVVGRLLLFVY